LLLLVGEITERPVVEAGAVVARPILPITATIDHRYADGWHVSRALIAFREYLADPGAFEPGLSDSTRGSRPVAVSAPGRPRSCAEGS
jgi:2-oxoacid dehydrogenases acyltransferase (catalytic domain)